jgi:hypothetical protein
LQDSARCRCSWWRSDRNLVGLAAPRGDKPKQFRGCSSKDSASHDVFRQQPLPRKSDQRTSARVRVMSALPPKADIGTQRRHVR